MAVSDDTYTKAVHFHSLHAPGKMLILPNAYDMLSAALVEMAGFPAIATASASIALTEGYADGEQLPFDRVLSRVNSIVQQTTLPVTVDFESGYSDNLELLAQNVGKLLDLGIAGINLEDTDRRSNAMYSLPAQAARIQTIRKVANEKGIPLFINARTDVIVRQPSLSKKELLEELIRRQEVYAEAGANGFFPIRLTGLELITQLIQAISLPLNILAMKGVPALAELESAGVRRVSTGPGLLKVCISALQETLSQIRSGNGFNRITQNEINLTSIQKVMSKQ